MTLFSEKNAEWFYEALSYLSKLDEDANICFYVTAFVRETAQVFTTQKVVAIDKPDLELEVSSTQLNNTYFIRPIVGLHRCKKVEMVRRLVRGIATMGAT